MHKAFTEIILFNEVLHILLVIHYNEVENSEKFSQVNAIVLRVFIHFLLFVEYPYSAHIGSLIFAIIT